MSAPNQGLTYHIETFAPTTIKSVEHLQDLCHDASTSAGWWTDLQNDKPLLESAEHAGFRNELIACKLMLITSEIGEAMEGLRTNAQDDKLPNRPMMEVELADALIRIFDLAGAMQFDLAGAVQEKLLFNARRIDHTLAARAKPHGKKF